MAKALVIVESPAKAKTIGKYLGGDFRVMASVGHVKDLPKDQLSVDIENGFEPDYQVTPDKMKVVKEIRKAAKSVETIYLAADPDREGEAIAAHLAEELSRSFKGDIYRLLLFEITKASIQESIKHPESLDVPKYEAQKARRVLDRLVGYQISPLLWEKVRFGLSAGRVQSVTMRLVCERERVIQQFQTKEYWSIHADTQNQDKKSVQLKFAQKGGKSIEIPDEKTAKAIVKEAEASPFEVSDVQKKKRQRNPVAPFITSTLQQEASRKLNMSSSQSMRVAQQLYEGVDEKIGGLITYMRTDSVRISDVAIKEVRQMIQKDYGKEFLPEKPRHYKGKKGGKGKIQDAHEAIRPTTMKYSPKQTKKFLNRDQQRLYELIWNRFVASQMASAEFDQTQVKVTNGDLMWRTTGSVLVFPGFLKLYMEGEDDPNKEEKEEEEQRLPSLEVGDSLTLKKIDPNQHFTEPPPRYNPPSLIKELEEKGIGRPSTFATIMSTIEKRMYVEKIKNRFFPTPTGMLVNDLLVENFPGVLNVTFTAQLEDALDDVEEGTVNWVDATRKFYEKFRENLEKAKVNMRDVKKQEIPTDIDCEQCGNMMVVKWGKNGEFLACSNYPDCKNTSEFQLNEAGKPEILKPEVVDIECEKCGSPFIIKNGRYGKFYACSSYPDCKNTKPLEQEASQPVEGNCEECGSGLVQRKGRYGPFIACEKYPDCKYIQKKQSTDTGFTCPSCKDGKLFEKRSRRGKVFYSCSNYPKCKFAMWDRPIEGPCPKCQYPVLGDKDNRKGHFIKCPNEDCGYSEAVDESEKDAA